MKREADDVGSQQGGTKKLRVDGRGRDVTLRFLLQSKVSSDMGELFIAYAFIKWLVYNCLFDMFSGKTRPVSVNWGQAISLLLVNPLYSHLSFIKLAKNSFALCFYASSMGVLKILNESLSCNLILAFEIIILR